MKETILGQLIAWLGFISLIVVFKALADPSAGTVVGGLILVLSVIFLITMIGSIIADVIANR